MALNMPTYSALIFDHYEKITDGIDPPGSMSIYLEMYRDTFLGRLVDSGFTSTETFEKIYRQMCEFNNVGDFLDVELDLPMLAAFGLVLLHRMAQTGWGAIDHEECFYLHEQVFECFEYVRDGDKKSYAARISAQKRHSKSRAAKNFTADEWTKNKVEYSNNKSEFARHYVRRIKHEFDVDVTEKTIREVWLSSAFPATE